MPKVTRPQLLHPVPRALTALKTSILPSLERVDTCLISLMEPPFLLAPGVKLEFKAGKPLAMKNALKGVYTGTAFSWEECGVYSTRFPYLGVVIKGEIDWRIGITQKIAKSLGGQFLKSNHAVFTIPENHFFLMSPGTPYASLPTITEQTPANLQMLWMRFHRLGFQYHLSTRLGDGTYYGEPDLYIPDSRTMELAQMLTEELRQEHPSAAMIRNFLHCIMLRFQRGLQNPLNQEAMFLPDTSHDSRSANHTVNQAISYIEANARFKLSINEVAAHVYTSPSHLRRIFQREKGMTLSEYAMHFRIDYACTLLTDTSFRVNHIGRAVGFHNSSSFCQIFRRYVGCTPLEYKQQHLNKQKVKSRAGEQNKERQDRAHRTPPANRGN